MGVSKFFRYISERYPCLSQLVKEFQIPDFDNLYLDMNGIIHACSHSNDFDPYFSITEEKIFASIFHYIEVLFSIIKPRKLLFMAVDGVAPRAKMNNQRARRFRAAKEAEMKEKEAKETDGRPLPKDRFDSNCITPGTVFMDHLHSQLKYFVTSKVSTDPLWQGCKIVLSGHQTPGEGEHKIMDYIRYLKTLPDYDRNTRHCLYGLDADLIMLGLCTHEPYFTLLREKVQFSNRHKKRMTSPDETDFYLLHLSLLREYLDLEFQDLKNALPFEYNLEKIVDDWVLMGFLVGNDFIPHLPDLHINKEAFPILYKAYKEVLPSLDGYLNENGYLSLARFEKYLEEMAKFDLEMFEDTYANLAFFEEKTGRSFASEKKPNMSPAKKSDLEELIKATEEFEMSDEESLEEHNDDDNDTFLWEFNQHKKHYYTNKLDYGHVTSEVMKSQAEGYVRAIQWNLHYYYQGCQSWSWYYPHHYSPYISDIKGFKDLKLDFEMGRPFLPFEQLLAVLPAASKNLLPEPYRDLMTSPDSPIIDFYPNDFQTDLNGKEQDWEAVVLIPFIDEERLLEAMKKPNRMLTQEERARNQHGPMHVFTYTQENLGDFKSVAYFPNVPANHALMENVTREAIAVRKDQLQCAPRTGVTPLTLFPGLPTLRHIPHTASLKLSKVKVFDSPSRGHNMVLRLKRREFPPLDVLAKDILGKIIYSNWPFLIESRVVAVSDGKVRYFLREEEGARNEELSRTMQACWAEEAQNLTTHYTKSLGVEIGDVEVIVYALTLEGQKCSFGSGGKVSNEKIWSVLPSPWPLQVVVREIAVDDSRTRAYAHFKDAFPDNAVVFMLGQPHFGSMARVLDSSDCCEKGRIKVALELVVECPLPESFSKCLQQLKTTYLHCRVAAQKVGVSPRLFSRITGAILVSMTNEDGLSNPGSKINIGLNLKFWKKNEELPGYTKRDGDNWTYSMAAVDIVSRYVEKFSRIIEYLSNNQNTNIYFIQDIFPGPEGATEMKEMINWIKEQEYQKVERLKCGSDVLDPEVISGLEKALETNEKRTLLIEMQVKPHLLYKSDLVMGNVPPVKSAKHKLLDRVVSIRSSYTVPTGLRGYVVGIHPSTSDADCVYDILFDQPFMGGMKLSTSSERVFKMSRASFLNLSDADRQCARPTLNLPEPSHKADVSLRPCYGEPKASAFAQWTHRPAPHQSAAINDKFKEIWSDLQRVKPQEDALKKILKIEKNEKEKTEIEEPVKWFFEKITKVPSDCAPHTTATKRNKYYLQLLAFFRKLDLGQPRFKFVHVGGKVMAQVVFVDGRIFSGLPCGDKESACESASLQALGALGQLPLCQDLPPQKDRQKFHPQAHPPTKPPPAAPHPLHHPAANVPASLPDPPSQWVRPNATCPSQAPKDPLPHRHRNQLPPKPQAPANNAHRKISASALEFVPLQAMTGKRHSSRPTATHARAHPHPHPPAHAHGHAPWPSGEPQKKTQVVATFFGNAGPQPSVTKPCRRRQKIAAKLDFDPTLC